MEPSHYPIKFIDYRINFVDYFTKIVNYSTKIVDYPVQIIKIYKKKILHISYSQGIVLIICIDITYVG